ncbi:hypothetical protein BDN72DRAFT_850647 [Pluteus cervinus]|uniref:Uncharacterized protein n=1 Tax=Pluteus cervinus TaxID=181527 RepID=A0ACD3A442_9AGAR|nr:hypothetical protein BDN72DRAFT_850647 [Pluteus cervinus]
MHCACLQFSLLLQLLLSSSSLQIKNVLRLVKLDIHDRRTKTPLWGIISPPRNEVDILSGLPSLSTGKIVLGVRIYTAGATSSCWPAFALAFAVPAGMPTSNMTTIPPRLFPSLTPSTPA